MRRSEDELRTTFHLFDTLHKGYITVQDLGRVAEEVAEQDSYDDSELGRMIDEFDTDENGCINFDEFKRIMKMG